MEMKAKLKSIQLIKLCIIFLIIFFILGTLGCKGASNLSEVLFTHYPPVITTLPEPSITRINHPTPTVETPPQSTETSIPLSTETICSRIIFHILFPVELEKDLFEHHAVGSFLIIHLEAINYFGQDIQMFNEDYHLHYFFETNQYDITPHPAATNYLYIRRGDNFYQDKIHPQSAWRTYLAFDVSPMIQEWQLIIKPGSKYQNSNCEYILTQTENQ